MKNSDIRSFQSTSHSFSNVEANRKLNKFLLFLKRHRVDVVIILDLIIYGWIDSFFTERILTGAWLEINPIANYDFLLFLITKSIVLGIIYAIMIRTDKTFAGLILLFISSVATIHNIGVIYF